MPTWHGGSLPYKPRQQAQINLGAGEQFGLLCNRLRLFVGQFDVLIEIEDESVVVAVAAVVCLRRNVILQAFRTLLHRLVALLSDWLVGLLALDVVEEKAAKQRVCDDHHDPLLFQLFAGSRWSLDDRCLAFLSNELVETNVRDRQRFRHLRVDVEDEHRAIVFVTI